MQTCALLLGLVMLVGAREGRPFPPDETSSSECCEFLREYMRDFLHQQVGRMTDELLEEMRRQEQRSAKALRDALQLQEAKTATALQGVVRQMESRLMGLEASCSRLLPLSIPQETPATPSASTPPSPSAPAANDPQTERKRVQERMKEARARWERAQAHPSPLGEALYKAAAVGSLEEVRRLLDEGADVNYTSSEGSSPLRAAAWKSGSPEVVSLLLSRGADVNAVDSEGWTALHWAAAKDNVPVMRLLLGAGAEVDAREGWGRTPLHVAAGYNKEAAVRALLAGGARKELKGWHYGYQDKTPFDVAKSDAIRNLLRT